jgi:hypothetical protein
LPSLRPGRGSAGRRRPRAGHTPRCPPRAARLLEDRDVEALAEELARGH